MNQSFETNRWRGLIRVALLAIAIVASGCQTNVPKVVVAEVIAQTPKIVTMAQASRCTNDLNQSELGQRIFSQIFYSDIVAPQHVQLMTLKRYLSDDEIELLNEFIEQNKECRSLRAQAFREHEFRAQLLIFHTDMDALFDDLLSRRISIGQSNTQFIKIRERYLIEVNKIYQRSREIDEERVG